MQRIPPGNSRHAGLFVLSYFSIAIVAVFAAAVIYLGLATVGVLLFAGRMRRASMTPAFGAPVTVLKPLCGDEPDLYENLRSFCVQEYPTYQVVFGVRDAEDPAIPVIEKLIAEHPDADIELVIDERIYGRNLKVSNLINMNAQARHDIIVVADSDMRVGPGYLSAVAGEFADPKVGAATCLYSGAGNANRPSRLGAMFINDWFLPSALIPTLFGELAFCFGATMAIRRDVLAEIGGFEALAAVLADDYMFGNAAHKAGYKVALVPYVVENRVFEPSFGALFRHETRWARTIRSVQPGGYAMSFVTEALPLSLLAAAAFWETGSAQVALLPIGIALSLRWVLHHAVQRGLANGENYSPWLIPLRDAFSLCVRIGSFFGRDVTWRGQNMTVRAESRLDPLNAPRGTRQDELEACDEKDVVSQPTYL